MPVAQDESNQLIPLKAAARMMELDESLLEWALSNGLLQGELGDDGIWYFNREAVEEGRLPLEKQFSHLLEKRSAEGLNEPLSQRRPRPSSADDRSSDFPRQSIDDSHVPEARELELLRKQLRDLNITISTKDSLIADLARSLARMGEAAIDRIPSQS